MFDRRIKKSIIVSGDNAECNCFGNAEPAQQLFLSKHKSLQIKDKTPAPLIAHLSQQQIQGKSISKRSLRKAHSPNNALTSRTKTDEYYNWVQTPPLKKQLRPQEKIVSPFHKSYDEKPYFTEQKRLPQPPVTVTFNHRPPIWTPVNHYPLAVTLSPPRYIITHNQPPKINTFVSAPLHHYTPQLSARSPIKPEPITPPQKIASLSELKQFVTICIKNQNRQPSKQSQSRCYQQQIIDFELTQDNVDSPRMMPVPQKMQKEPFSSLKIPPKDEKKEERNEYNFGQVYKSKIVKPKSKTKVQSFKSIIEQSSKEPTWKSLTEETTRQKIGVKQKKSLRKMDDVDEIRSMGGSEKEQDDKQSVVVGRLRQYGSMLDPTLSLTTPTLGSKLVSMNTQSSVGKSFLRSFQYPAGERSHFK